MRVAGLFRLALLTAFCICSIGLVSAGASSITYTFSGTVTAVDAQLGPTFDTSQTMSGAFTYDSSAPLQFMSGTDASGFANYFPAVIDFSITVGSYTASLVPSGGLVQVGNNTAGVDRFLVGAPTTGAVVNGLSNPIGHLTLLDSNQTVFSDIQLLDVGSLGLAGFTQATWNLSFGNAGGPPFVQGQLTSLVAQTNAVPEPATLTLLGTGLVVVVRRRLGTRHSG